MNDFYTNNPGSAYGLWILIAEIGICGIVPAAILISDRGRKTQATLWLAIVLAVVGVSLNRWVMVLQVLAVPVLSFETWNLYFPSWQEVATTILPVALGTICISISYRYLPIFPQERELNPIDTPADDAAGAENAESDEVAEGELKPAEV